MVLIGDFERWKEGVGAPQLSLNAQASAENGKRVLMCAIAVKQTPAERLGGVMKEKRDDRFNKG